MENTEHNGYKNPRMDRLENLMELVIADHVKFADEHNKLLTSQVLLTDRMDRLTDGMGILTGGMGILTDGMAKLTDRMEKLTGTVQDLAESQKATDARLGIVIQMMDNFIRERGDKK
jgi:X-X-X-Leu-X-X-Gly heptad repeat protein